MTFRKLKNIDIAEFSADIASSMLCASVHWDNIDALSDCFNMTLTDILDKHAPLKTRIMINCPRVPWFNDDIKQLKRKRRRLEKNAHNRYLHEMGKNLIHLFEENCQVKQPYIKFFVGDDFFSFC